MTLLGNAQDVNAVVQQRHFVSFRESSSHQALALEVYQQLVERFGALPDVLLVRLSHSTVEQLSRFERCVAEACSFEDFAAKVGWLIPQGGEGNYPVEGALDTLSYSEDEHRLAQERLCTLRQALAPTKSGFPMSRVVTRSRDDMYSVSATPFELFAFRCENDVLGVLI